MTAIEIIAQKLPEVVDSDVRVNIEFEGNDDLLFLIASTYEQRLIIAAALIVAEIDRLQNLNK